MFEREFVWRMITEYFDPVIWRRCLKLNAGKSNVTVCGEDRTVRDVAIKEASLEQGQSLKHLGWVSLGRSIKNWNICEYSIINSY